MRLLSDVEQSGRVCLLLEERPEERVTEAADLDCPLPVSWRDTALRVLGLRLADNGNQQVEHEDNEEEADQEENNPVYVAERFDILSEISETSSERRLPDA